MRQLFVGLVLALMTVSAFAQANPPVNPPANPPGTMTPEMKAQMMAMMQDMMIMAQNSAIATTEGLVVLQGNRLLRFPWGQPNPDRTLTLPLPAATPAPPAGQMVPVRGMLPTQLINTTERGLIVIRGRQIIQVDRAAFTVTSQRTIPELPALTAAEMNAICPMCNAMMMMPMGGTMPGMGMPPMANPTANINEVPAAEPAIVGEEKPAIVEEKE